MPRELVLKRLFFKYCWTTLHMLYTETGTKVLEEAMGRIVFLVSDSVSDCCTPAGSNIVFIGVCTL